MSKILAELKTAAKMEPKRGESNEDFLMRLVTAIGAEIDDDAWSGLSPEAQDWNNDAADAITKNEPIPAPPDAEPEEAPAPAPSRRRGAAAAAPAAAAPVPYVPAKGDEVKVETKRGKSGVGFIVDIDDDVIVLNPAADGAESDDTEFARSTLTSIVKVDATGAPTTTPASAEPAEPGDPAVGDTVEVTTKRGKKIVGNIIEITDEELVVEDAAGFHHELAQSTLTSVVVKVTGSGAGRAAPAAAPAPATSRRGAAAPAAAPAADAAPKRSSNAPGVSLGGRIRELVCENPKLTVDQVSDQLKKENIQFRDTSVKMIHKEVNDVLAILRTLNKLK